MHIIFYPNIANFPKPFDSFLYMMSLLEFQPHLNSVHHSVYAAVTQANCFIHISCLNYHIKFRFSGKYTPSNKFALTQHYSGLVGLIILNFIPTHTCYISANINWHNVAMTCVYKLCLPKQKFIIFPFKICWKKIVFLHLQEKVLVVTPCNRTVSDEISYQLK